MKKSLSIVKPLFFSLSIALVSIACGPKEAQDMQHDEHQHAKMLPAAAVKGISNGQMQISEQDRCPVCGMKVSNHAKFASGLQLKEGQTYYFCGNGCLVRSYLNPDKYLHIPRQSISQLIVQDYFSGEHINALEAFWVSGSDVVGPMGPAHVALKNESDVETFRQRHGGDKAYRLEELDSEIWKEITSKKIKPTAQ